MDKIINTTIDTAIAPVETSVTPSIFLEVQETRLTKNIPTGETISLVEAGLAGGAKLPELPARRKRQNRHAQISVLENGGNKQAIDYTSESQHITIVFDNIDKLAAKKKGTSKFFTLALEKLTEQALNKGELFNNTIKVSIKELLERGFYADAKGARRGFDTAMDTLTTIKVKAEIKEGKTKVSTAKEVLVLFTGYERDNSGNCYIFLNERLNWKALAQYYTIIPSYYPKLTSNGLDLLNIIMNYARLPQNRKDLADKGHFFITLKAVQNALYLPDEEASKNPDRDIKQPIERALEDIETQEAGRGLLYITPTVDGTEPIKEYLKGHLKIELKGEYLQRFIDITESQEKKIASATKRKNKIEDNAKAIALAEKYKNE